MSIIFNRTWAMPNKNTFQIKPIKELIEKYLHTLNDNSIILNPFANSSIYGITNDIDPQYNTHYNMDALDFFKQFEDNSVDCILYDPPFTVRQVSECYKKMGLSVNMETTQASYWTKQKKQIARITKKNGLVICFGYNSGGIGQKLGFEIEEILLVPHGGIHNDTIVTVCRKVV